MTILWLISALLGGTPTLSTTVTNQDSSLTQEGGTEASVTTTFELRDQTDQQGGRRLSDGRNPR